MKYCIGTDIDGFETIDIDSDSLGNASESEIIVVLGENSTGQLNKYYVAIKNILSPKKLNRLIIILDGTTSNIRKQICMLCVSMECYDIYTVDDLSIVDKEYVDTLLNRNPTEEEVETFVGSDLIAYSELSQFVIKLNALALDNNTDGIQELIAGNKNIIYDFPPLIDYMKRIVDTHNTGLNAKLSELQLEIDRLSEDNKSLKLDLHTKIEALEKTSTSLEGLESEIKDYRYKCKNLEEQLEESDSSGLYKYIPIKVNKVKGVKVKCIIYFKEISPVLYINSLIKYLKECISVYFTDENLKAKIVVYDRPGDFAAIYSPLTMVSGSKFHDNPDILDGGKDLLITEPNMGITEALLKVDSDILIIYDKLKSNQDLVEGNTVTKFTVIGSSSDITKLEQSRSTKLERDKVIANVGACQGSLYINYIEDFKKAGNTAKMSKYCRLQCGSGLLIQTILEQCGLKFKS